MKTYELICIVSASLSPEEVDKVGKATESLVQNKEGMILKSEKTMAKTLAYPIKKQSSGYYLTTLFKIEEDKINEIGEQLRKNNNIIRHLITIKKPVKEIKRRVFTKPTLESLRFKPDAVESVKPSMKTEKIEVKQEDIEKELKEILSE